MSSWTYMNIKWPFLHIFSVIIIIIIMVTDYNQHLLKSNLKQSNLYWHVKTQNQAWTVFLDGNKTPILIHTINMANVFHMTFLHSGLRTQFQRFGRGPGMLKSKSSMKSWRACTCQERKPFTVIIYRRFPRIVAYTLRALSLHTRIECFFAENEPLTTVSHTR